MARIGFGRPHDRGNVIRNPLVMITGAAGALGRASVRSFLDAGCRVLGFDRDPAVETSSVDEYQGVAMDLLQPDAEKVVRTAIDQQPLRHLVGIAGGALPGEPESRDEPLEVSLALFRASIEANLVSQFGAIRSALPALRADRGHDRSITLISSFNALGAQGMPAYSASKAGIIGMMRALVDPLGAEGIRINVVAPGTIRTPRTERLWSGVPEHFERLERSTALGRLGEPVDVAEAINALALRLTHVTGQTLVVDGGQVVIHR